jgi:hypothetical protein
MVKRFPNRRWLIQYSMESVALILLLMMTWAGTIDLCSRQFLKSGLTLGLFLQSGLTLEIMLMGVWYLLAFGLSLVWFRHMQSEYQRLRAKVVQTETASAAQTSRRDVIR